MNISFWTGNGGIEGISVTPWSCPLNIVEPYSGRWASSTVFEVQFSSMHSHLYSSLRWFNRLKTWGSAISQQKCLKWLSEIGVTTLFIYLIYMYMHATRSVWRSINLLSLYCSRFIPKIDLVAPTLRMCVRKQHKTPQSCSHHLLVSRHSWRV